jgi:DNA repair exonuclease SbcCD ATPase subunit
MTVRIESLDLTAFRSFVNVSLALPASRVLVAGVNGTGKTTIREALKWILTGRCQGLDGKGHGTEVLVPPGSSAVEAAATVAGVGRVARSATNGSGGLTVAGFTGTSQTQQLALYAKLGTQAGLLDAVLDTRAFLDLHHADAKALVLGLLNVHITLGEAPDSPTYSLTELDSLYQQAFEDRKIAKKVLAALGTAQKPSEEPQPTVAAVDEQLRKLRAQMEAARTAIGETTGRRGLLESRRESLRGAAPRPTPRGEDELIVQIGDLEERLAIMETEAGDALPPAPAGDTAQPVMLLRHRAEALAAHKPPKGCVLDPSVPCKTPATEFKQAAKQIKAEISLRADDAVPASPASPLTAVRQMLAQQTQQLAALQAWQQGDTRRQADLAAVEAELATLPDTSAQDAQIATLRSRIQKGETILRQAQAHWTAVAAYEEQERQRSERRQEVERLETLCTTLGPNGVRVQALQEAIGRFETLVNLSTSQFGWTVRFVLDPWGVVVNDRPVETYSRSEQFRIGIAVQLAIATLSGLHFAVIDELDMLDVANRGIVTQMVLQSPLEQVIVLGTREAGTPLPKTPGVIAYRLGQHGGRTVVLEQSGAAVAA